MLADTLTMVGAAFIGLVGATLLLMIVLHTYAWWTLRRLRDFSAGPGAGRSSF